ncbi:MAG: hypothetical protein KA140_03475 [Caldisericia bacterium]|nr:hypothetical protein [Caldisericia bacterium]
MKKFLFLALSLMMVFTVLPTLQASAITGMITEGGPPGQSEPPGDRPGGDKGDRGGQDNSQIATTWSSDPEKTLLDAGETATFKLTVENKTSASESITLSTQDTGLTISPKTFTLAASAKSEVTLTVVMPAQNDRTEANFSINFACTNVKNKKVMFRIKYKTQTAAQKADQQIATQWESDPGKTVLAAGKSATFKLKVTNKSGSNQSITLSTKNTGLTISPTTLTLGNSASSTVSVTVVMPAQTDAKKLEVEFAISFACTSVTGKAVKFKLRYASATKPEQTKTIATVWAAEPSKTTLNAGSTASFTLKITNKSTVSDTITLSTKSAGLTLSSTKTTIAAGKTVSVTVKVVMPAQNNRAQADFLISLVGAKSKVDVKFSIKYKTAPCCTYTTVWASNPNGAKLAQKTKGAYYLTITNKCTSAITFKLTPGKNMAVSSSSFTLAAGKATKITVTVTMPAKTTSSKCDFSLVVGTSCGKNSTLKFTINYK